MTQLNALQQLFLASKNDAPEYLAAIKTGVFYSDATMLYNGDATLARTELGDGTPFPCLYASQEEAQAEVNDEVSVRRSEQKKDVENGDLDEEDYDPEDDFDLAVVEVLWNGGNVFVIDGREVTLETVLEGC